MNIGGSMKYLLIFLFLLNIHAKENKYERLECFKKSSDSTFMICNDGKTYKISEENPNKELHHNIDNLSNVNNGITRQDKPVIFSEASEGRDSQGVNK